MPIRLDARAADFRSAISCVPRHQARGLVRRRAGGARHHRGCGGARRRGAGRTDQQIRSCDHRRERPARHAGRTRRRDRGLRREGARCAQARARPHRGLSQAPAAEGRPLDRSARRRARPSLDRHRGRRPLCAGRHGRLSVVRADERCPREGRGLPAHRDGGAGAGRQAQSAGARGRQARRHRRNLSHRRRAGGGGARLRHADDSRRWRRSSGPAMPMWRRRSASCSAASAST